MLTPDIRAHHERSRGQCGAGLRAARAVGETEHRWSCLARRDIKSLLYLLVDVVIQCGVERHERFIKEIWFQPERKRRDRAGLE